jgi:adenosine deaminase
VASALDALAPNRIAHGVGAAEDTRILARLVAAGVTCDVCPTANLRLGVVSRFELHPVGRMMEAGVAVTLNADCPVDFGATCGGEYQRVCEVFGLSDDQLAAMARTSALASGAAERVKQRITQDIDQWRASASAS